ncbi:MAG: energy transducer TonB [Pyrinomonadaceae bacterium]
MLAPNVPAATLTALSLVLSVILALILFAQPPTRTVLDIETEEPAHLVIIELSAKTDHEGAGVGTGSKGRVGFASGKGEGSDSESQASRGGGGGGEHNFRPAQHGGVPQPSEVPAPITPPLPHAMLPIAGVDLDPALWARLPLTTYGDPRSKSEPTSNGPGEGGGIGTGTGQGVGDGRGNGIGRGEDGNIGGGRKNRGSDGIGGADDNDPRDTNRIFKADQVTQRARIVFKPEPQYTEEARRNQITGTAILRVVFSLSGEVTDIRAVHRLPMGLTERAIAAARQIRFLPATRNGRPVSVYVQLEYSFNLY